MCLQQRQQQQHYLFIYMELWKAHQQQHINQHHHHLKRIIINFTKPIIQNITCLRNAISCHHKNLKLTHIKMSLLPCQVPTLK